MPLLLLLSACTDLDAPTPPPAVPAEVPKPLGMEGATCAVLPTEGNFGTWKHGYTTADCLRELAYEDWTQASLEAAHIESWSIGHPTLGELTHSLTRYDSADKVEADLTARGLLGGEGDADFLEYADEGWQPLTVNDFLRSSGNWYWFDVETGTYPNNHDYLLYSLAELYGEPFEGAEFTEQPPPMDDDEAAYRIHATLGDREWERLAENYGDWYDVEAVLGMLNEMAADLGLAQRAMPLVTGDQTAIVIVAPGEALLAAAGEGLIRPGGMREGMDAGKAFEDALRSRYRVQ